MKEIQFAFCPGLYQAKGFVSISRISKGPFDSYNDT